MDGEEIWAALAANNDRTDPVARAARAEYLVEAAEAAGDTLLLVTALQQLISAFEFNGESDKMLTPFARVLRFWDTESGSFDAPRRHTMFWQFKWTTSQLLTLPQVPLGTIRQWLAEMESRYRQAGFSARPVHQSRHYLASHIGDAETAQAGFDAWLTEPRDEMADCEACERNAQGDWSEEQGQDEQALTMWAPVLNGELTCAEEPHRLLGTSLLPLLRLGRTDEARGNHLRGYRMVRGRPNLRAAVGAHLAFCALTGNTARGLEILAEHKTWLDHQGENISKRRSFLEGVSVLLRQLEAQGQADLAVVSTDVRTLRASVDAEIDATCARYDVRNGNTHVSGRSARYRAQQPLVEHLPLGSSAPPSRAGLGGTAAAPAPTPPIESSLDDQVAEARRLSELAHPRALAAWERIARTAAAQPDGGSLPALVQAQIDRARARTLRSENPAAALPVLRELADRLAALEAPAGLLLRSRSDLVIGLFLAGEREESAQLDENLDTAVEAAYANGALTDREYVRLRSHRLLMSHQSYNELAEADPASGPRPDPEPAKALLRAEADLAERLGDPAQSGLYHRMLAQHSIAAERFDEAEALLTTAAERFLAGGCPWSAAEEYCLLGQLALRGARPVEGEEFARNGQRHGADLIPPELGAQLSSLLVDALIRQGDRDADLVDAALRAAGAWAAISEPDTVHNHFTAARAYLALKRFGEAAALFEEFLPRAGAAYDGVGIAQTREQFATCLTELGEHRQAAEQLLAAAQLVQDDPANQRAHARLAWTAAQALEQAGLPGAALPAYRRAAELWGELGAPAARVRCLRSAAWLSAWTESHGAADAEMTGPHWSTAIAAMRAVLAELEATPKAQQNDLIIAELANTQEQLSQMLEQQAQAENDETGPQH